MIPNALPQSLQDNPRPDQWLSFEADRTVTFRVGKVEIGQGILTALRQIAAEELDLAPARLRMAPAQTGRSPNEGLTSGSLSVETSGAAIRLICAEVRARMLAEAGRRIGADPTTLAVEDGEVRRNEAPTGHDYWSLAPAVDLAAPVSGAALAKAPAEYRVVGLSERRLDLPDKIFGAPFVHDLAPPGLLHARVLHRPWPGARLESADPDLSRFAGPGAEVVREGDWAAFLSPDENLAAAALERAWARAAWSGGEPLPDEAAEASGLLGREVAERQLPADGDAPKPSGAPAFRLRARYSRPFLAHASIGPSCALAHFEGGRLEVWTHSQGIWPLRAALSRILGIEPGAIAVHHRQGAGCYGHNGADDAALDAALIAVRRPGEPIRVLWTREDELSQSPFGPAGVTAIEAECDEDGRALAWAMTVTSPVHAVRPGMGTDDHMLSRPALSGRNRPDDERDVPEERGGGATRNALALYDLPPQRITHRLVRRPPVRTSAMRGLGALLNVFAIESFVDEIAERAGRDPVEWRLSMLPDPRARRVVGRAAAMAGWPGPGAAEGSGLGFAFSRYKNHAGYAAVVADVEVAEEVRVRRLWAAVDAGLVINPDGARNQIEGGMIQATSWALKEQVRFAEGRVESATWDRYPVLTFSEVPAVAIELVGDPRDLPLGLGEVALGPTVAAIGNAVARALGLRIRDLPLTRERLVAAAMAGEPG